MNLITVKLKQHVLHIDTHMCSLGPPLYRQVYYYEACIGMYYVLIEIDDIDFMSPSDRGWSTSHIMVHKE
jgi:hypothetical protein